MTKLAQVVIDLSKDGYPELEEKKDMILRVIDQEEERFANTIDKGLEILADLEKDMEAKGTKVLAGEDAFKLYDTYGFPIDLTKEILDDKGLTVDEEGFHKGSERDCKKCQKDHKLHGTRRYLSETRRILNIRFHRI